MILSRYLVAPVEQFVKAAVHSVSVEVVVVAVYFVESVLEAARHSVGSDLLRTEHPFSASPDSTCHRTLSKSRNSDSVDTPSESGRSICCWVVQLPVAVLAEAEDSVVVQLSVAVTVPVHLLLR